MKFRAVRDGIGIKAGTVYFGSIITAGGTEVALEGHVPMLMIVVFNSNGRWHPYPPHLFEPSQS